MINKIIKELKDELKYIEYHNSMSPFPIFDTEYVEEVRKKLNLFIVMKDKKEYDDIPVVACKNCKSLHIIEDEVNNSICMRCNSINETVEFDSIYDYKREKNIWNEEE